MIEDDKDMEILVEPASAIAFMLEAGDHLRVIDIEGQQVGDLVLFNTHNHSEKLSTSYSRSEASMRIGFQGILTPSHISVGNKLMSTLRNPMMHIIADTPNPKGRHDTFYRSCSARSWELFGLSARDGCLELLGKALYPYGIHMGDIPDPFNIFMNTYQENGMLTIGCPVSKKGDYIELGAEMDLLCAISTCPENDHLLVNGPIPHKCKSLRIIMIHGCEVKHGSI